MTIVCANCGSAERDSIGWNNRCARCGRPEIQLGPEAGLAFDALRGGWRDPYADSFELPQLDLPELEAILSAHRGASPAASEALRVRVRANTVFTRDGLGCDLCGFWHRWRETVAYFTPDGGTCRLCPCCLWCDIDEGSDVLVNPDELERLITGRCDELRRADDGHWRRLLGGGSA